MVTIYIKNKSELFEKVKVALHNFKDFDVTYKGKVVKVTTSNDGFINLTPHNQRLVWDSKYVDDFLQEIVSDIKYSLFKNKNLIHITTITDTTGQKKWFFDKRNGKLFYVYDGKLFIKTAQDSPLYDAVLRDAEDRFGINRIVITDTYRFCEEDLEQIKDTDIDPDYFRKLFISRWKGKTWNHNMARLLKVDMHYKYKVRFNCDYCGKESFFWMTYNPMAFTDHWGPDFCCDKCEAEWKEKYKKKTDEQNRIFTEAAKVKFQSIKPTFCSTNTKLFDEKPMESPKDTIFYVESMMRRTRG